MFYFLLFVAYGFLFLMNYHSVSNYVSGAFGLDPCAPVDDEEQWWEQTRHIAFLIYGIAFVLPALEIYGMYLLFTKL